MIVRWNAPFFSRGFVVSSSVIHLDLRESLNQSPILFICEEKQLAKSLKFIKENLAESSPVAVYWEYYDEDRETFEIEIFRTFEAQMLQERMDISLGKCMDNDYEESAGRFFSILQTYFAISDNPQKMHVLHLLWRSVPDADKKWTVRLKNSQEQARIFLKSVKLLCGGKDL
ncbi:hypothetical protein AVEN_93432-1 [Araneus ventricosus]|uniref:Uncharacterized protein n=1 Tax=Araneus ventricosus TaxID=182803 RepID=A0A4Y2AP17_ARAVE|nr:hypothetical protein AVEN_93432-1 [Araneus ventricosus]